jgi:hypothetical protein
MNNTPQVPVLAPNFLSLFSQHFMVPLLVLLSHRYAYCLSTCSTPVCTCLLYLALKSAAPMCTPYRHNRFTRQIAYFLGFLGSKTYVTCSLGPLFRVKKSSQLTRYGPSSGSMVPLQCILLVAQLVSWGQLSPSCLLLPRR